MIIQYKSEQISVLQSYQLIMDHDIKIWPLTSKYKKSLVTIRSLKYEDKTYFLMEFLRTIDIWYRE